MAALVTVGLPMHTSHDEVGLAGLSDDELLVSRYVDETSEDDDSDEGSSLTEQLKQLSVGAQQRRSLAPAESRLSGNNTEDLMRDQKHRLSVYLSKCATNDRAGIRALMTKYDDDFLAASDQTGNNGIALTAANGHLELLQWLREQGCNIDGRNHGDQTPLMIASQRAQPRVVEYLLENRADAALRDSNGRSALDLVLQDPCIKVEKRHLSYYREPQEADLCRLHIAFRLRSIPETITPLKQDSDPERQENTLGFFLDARTSLQSGTVEYYELVQRYSIPNANKAIGRLHRGPLFPVISAMSGYSQSEWEPTTILDNAKWTAEVMELGRKLKIPVAQTYASHVEKQLLAYYVSKHILLDDEHLGLHDGKPRDPPVRATIVVSKDEVCLDCQIFIKRILDLVPMSLTVNCSGIKGKIISF
ncbi:MAG: hypothetical protein Q9226_002226 [Calogaya cf. arnoldii]